MQINSYSIHFVFSRLTPYTSQILSLLREITHKPTTDPLTWIGECRQGPVLRNYQTVKLSKLTSWLSNCIIWPKLELLTKSEIGLTYSESEIGWNPKLDSQHPSLEYSKAGLILNKINLQNATIYKFTNY